MQLYMDCTQYTEGGDSILAISIVNVLSGRRHLSIVIVKSEFCSCGCYAWCTLFPIFDWLAWCAHRPCSHLTAWETNSARTGRPRMGHISFHPSPLASQYVSRVRRTTTQPLDRTSNVGRHNGFARILAHPSLVFVPHREPELRRQWVGCAHPGAPLTRFRAPRLRGQPVLPVL